MQCVVDLAVAIWLRSSVAACRVLHLWYWPYMPGCTRCECAVECGCNSLCTVLKLMRDSCMPARPLDPTSSREARCPCAIYAIVIVRCTCLCSARLYSTRTHSRTSNRMVTSWLPCRALPCCASTPSV